MKVEEIQPCPDEPAPNEQRGARPHSITNPMVVGGIFYIPSDALLRGINKIVLKDNECFTVLDSCGESPRIYDRELGFYFCDTRYLDVWELTINGEAVTSLTTDPKSNARSYVFMMANRDVLSLDGKDLIPRNRLRILRVLTVEQDQVYEQVEIVNYDHRPHTLLIERRAASRFNDIFEVRGKVRTKRGCIHPPSISEDRTTVTLRYTGLDGRRYRTEIWSSDPMEDPLIEPNGVVMAHRIDLAPREARTIQYVIAFDSAPVLLLAQRPFAALSIEKHIQHVAEDEEATKLPLPEILADSPRLSRALAYAGSDLASLLTRRNGTSYPDAGIPWFCAPFGRDGIITAYQMLPWCPEIAEGVLRFAFAHLGTKEDEFTDQEPGKVFHELRFGEMARTREIPFIPYYGSVDATPLALMLFGEYIAWTDRFDVLVESWDRAVTALQWILRSLASSKRGFLSYAAKLPSGLFNQGWKDSHDSVMHADGACATLPIALCEVQGYAYAALLTMSRLATLLGRKSDAREWEKTASELRARFLQHFWDEERGIIHLALDGDDRPCAVATSNQGHCLWTRIVRGHQAELIARRLLDDTLFTGFGIRTLASNEKAYNPLSYHNGSVWPHDNSLIAAGLRSYDRVEELSRLATGLIGVVETVPDARLPELFCGFARYGKAAPVPYDVACKPQAWAAGALFLLMRSLLGISRTIEERALTFRAPVLPVAVKTLEVRRLRVGDGEIDFVARRGRTSCTVEVLRKTGSIGPVVVVKT